MKKGINEVEIEAPTSTLKDVIGMISEIMENIPLDTESHVIKDPRNISYTIQSGRDEVGTETSNIPEINISKDDSLSSVLVYPLKYSFSGVKYIIKKTKEDYKYQCAN